MSVEAVLELAQKVGLPVVLLGAGAFLLWKVLSMTLARLVEAYRERIAALEADRMHFRDRAEAHDDRANGLCRELIDEARKRAGREG